MDGDNLAGGTTSKRQRVIVKAAVTLNYHVFSFTDESLTVNHARRL